MAGEGNKGWISLYRSVQDHWLWQEKPFSKGQAWIDLLLSANHEDKKIALGNELILVKRGSFITSELKLMERWGWGKEKTRKFLKLLQDDGMIVKISDRKKTTINIVNYNDYQQSLDCKQTINRLQTDHEQTASRPRADTNNNDNNDNNDNNTTTTIYSKNHAKNNKCRSSGDENFNIFKFLEKCNFILSPMLAEKIQSDIEEFSLEEVKKAIEIADSNGKHTYNYVKGILEKRRAGVNEKLDKEKAREQAFKEFLEED